MFYLCSHQLLITATCEPCCVCLAPSAGSSSRWNRGGMCTKDAVPVQQGWFVVQRFSLSGLRLSSWHTCENLILQKRQSIIINNNFLLTFKVQTDCKQNNKEKRPNLKYVLIICALSAVVITLTSLVVYYSTLASNGLVFSSKQIKNKQTIKKKMLTLICFF